MDNEALKNIFGRFAGLEVPMEEKTFELNLPKTGRQTIKDWYPKNNPDPVIKEMEDLAAQHGLRLRVWFPGTVGTMDYRLDRLNVHVEQDEQDGKWKISPRMNLG